MFDPTAYPYVRARTFADKNPPAVLSDEFYNPTQDALARLYGAAAGYSTSLSYEEFERFQLPFSPVTGDLLGSEIAVQSVPVGGFAAFSMEILPLPSGTHGALRILGNSNGNRGGAPLIARDARRNIGTLNWIYRVRVEVSDFTVLGGLGVPGLNLGLGDIASGLPRWFADETGNWGIGCDSVVTHTSVTTVPGAWITLWITMRDGDGIVRFYAKKDTDPVPLLAFVATLNNPSLDGCSRFLSYQVNSSATVSDSIDLDSMSLMVQR